MTKFLKRLAIGSAFSLAVCLWIVVFWVTIDKLTNHPIVGGPLQVSPAFPCGPKVLVFHAKWCQFCPTDDEINRLQATHPDCEIVNIDIDKYPDLKLKYHVKAVPRFFVCDDKGCKTTESYDVLKGWLKDYAKSN